MAPSSFGKRLEFSMPRPNDVRRCSAILEQDSTLIAVIEVSQSSWLVAGIGPGADRHPVKKVAASENELLKLLRRWRNEAGPYVIHPSSVAVPREHRRVKTDRLDTELLKRTFLGWPARWRSR
jgi:transposase